MFCQKCGAQNSDDSKFCCNCAQPLSTGVVADSAMKAKKSKLFSANILNIVSAVVLVLSIALIAYGVSTADGSFSNTTQTGGITSSTTGSVQFDTSGAPLAYTACAIDAVVVLIGLVVFFCKNSSAQKGLSVLYMIGACAMTCVLFFAGIKTIAFTCGLGFVMTVAGILQIVAGAKFLSAT